MKIHRSLARRTFVAGAMLSASGAVAKADDGSRARFLDMVNPRSRISVIYIGAWDCPGCQHWKKTELPGFLKTPLAKRVVYREVEAYSFKQLDYLPAWPEDFRWFQAKLKITRGTPRFYALVENPDRTALWFGGFGTARWARDVLPLAEEAARKRDGA